MATTPASTNKKPETGKPGTVTVGKADLDAILSELKELRESREQDKETLDLLRASADPARVDRVLAKSNKKRDTIVRLRLWKGKVVLAWSDAKEEDNRVQKINNVYVSMQNTTIFMEDGKSEKLDYLLFQEKHEKADARLVSRTESEQDGKFVRVFHVQRLDNGKEYDIQDTFVN